MFRIKDGKFLIVDGKFAVGAPGTPCGCCGGVDDETPPCSECLVRSGAGLSDIPSGLVAAPSGSMTKTQGTAPAQARYSVTMASSYLPNGIDVKGNYSFTADFILTDYPVQSSTHQVASDFLSISSSTIVSASSPPPNYAGAGSMQLNASKTNPAGETLSVIVYVPFTFDPATKNLAFTPSIFSAEVTSAPPWGYYSEDAEDATSTSTTFTVSLNIYESVGNTLADVFTATLTHTAGMNETQDWTLPYSDPEGLLRKVLVTATQVDDGGGVFHIYWAAYENGPLATQIPYLDPADPPVLIPLDTFNANDTVTVEIPFDWKHSVTGVVTPSSDAFSAPLTVRVNVTGIIKMLTATLPVTPSPASGEINVGRGGQVILNWPSLPATTPATFTTASGASVTVDIPKPPHTAPDQMRWTPTSPDSWQLATHGLDTHQCTYSVTLNPGGPSTAVTIAEGQTIPGTEANGPNGLFRGTLSIHYGPGANQLVRLKMTGIQKWHAASSTWLSPGAVATGETVAYWTGSSTAYADLDYLRKTAQSGTLTTTSGLVISPLVYTNSPPDSVWHRQPAAHYYWGNKCFFPAGANPPIKVCGIRQQGVERSLLVTIDLSTQSVPGPTLTCMRLFNSGSATWSYSTTAAATSTWTYLLEASLAGDTWSGTLTETITDPAAATVVTVKSFSGIKAGGHAVLDGWGTTQPGIPGWKADSALVAANKAVWNWLSYVSRETVVGAGSRVHHLGECRATYVKAKQYSYSTPPLAPFVNQWVYLHGVTSLPPPSNSRIAYRKDIGDPFGDYENTLTKGANRVDEGAIGLPWLVKYGPIDGAGGTWSFKVPSASVKVGVGDEGAADDAMKNLPLVSGNFNSDAVIPETVAAVMEYIT